MGKDNPDCNTVVARYFGAPQPNLPKDLQFLSPDTQREVHTSYRTFYKLNGDELEHREDLIVDALVYFIAPRMLCSRYDTDRRFPKDEEELDIMIECYTWILLNDALNWKKLKLPYRTKELLVEDVRIAIEPFIHGGDYGVSAEVCGQIARERLFAAGVLPLRSQVPLSTNGSSGVTN